MSCLSLGRKIRGDGMRWEHHFPKHFCGTPAPGVLLYPLSHSSLPRDLQFLLGDNGPLKLLNLPGPLAARVIMWHASGRCSKSLLGELLGYKGSAPLCSLPLPAWNITGVWKGCSHFTTVEVEDTCEGWQSRRPEGAWVPVPCQSHYISSDCPSLLVPGCYWRAVSLSAVLHILN